MGRSAGIAQASPRNGDGRKAPESSGKLRESRPAGLFSPPVRRRAASQRTLHHLAIHRPAAACPRAVSMEAGAVAPAGPDKLSQACHRVQAVQSTVVADNLTAEGSSSIGQSPGLQNRWLGVRVPPALRVRLVRAVKVLVWFGLAQLR